jgi:hypothetical protein
MNLGFSVSDSYLTAAEAWLSLLSGRTRRAELCSFAPLDVSLPASPAGALDGFMVSAASTGLAQSSSAAAAVIKYRVYLNPWL